MQSQIYAPKYFCVDFLVFLPLRKRTFGLKVNPSFNLIQVPFCGKLEICNENHETIFSIPHISLAFYFFAGSDKKSRMRKIFKEQNFFSPKTKATNKPILYPRQ